MRRQVLFVMSLFVGLVALRATLVRAVDEPSAKPPKATAPAQPAPSKLDIEQWIADLNAPEFAKREEATRQLIDAGVVAVEPLIEVSKSSGLEVSVRITAVLRAWFTSGQEELVEAAETALEQLSESKNRSIANRSVAVLNQYALTIRQDRALAQIKLLGGTIKSAESVTPQQFAQNDSDRFFIVLGLNWQGGEEGLKHIRRLPSLSTLYVIQHPKTKKILTPNVSLEAITELKKVMPQLAIVPRGPAYLGVSPQERFGKNGCVIGVVPPGTPAAKAKLVPGDVITSIEGKPVSDFDGLIDLIAEQKPGDVIKLEILRGEENDMITLERLRLLPEPNPAKEAMEELRKRLTKEIKVTLEGW